MTRYGKTRSRRKGRPPRYYRLRRDALREARRLNRLRVALLVHKPADPPPPVSVWKYVGGYLGRGYYVGAALPTRITASKAVVTLVLDGHAEDGGVR